MQASLDFLYTKFDEYNKRCFGGKLKRPQMVVNNAKRQLGLFMASRPTPTIKMSNFYDRTEAEYVDTLVHEMIHYYIYASGVRDSSPHGTLFKAWMNKLNRQEGLHMSVRTNAQKWDTANTTMKKRYVLFIQLQTGKHFISVVSPRHVNNIESQLQQMGGKIALRKWFVTNHPDYQNYSIVRSLRGRPCTEEVFNQKLREMEEHIRKQNEGKDTPSTEP